jgi:bifunctional non-homologous end joining protein LigD
VRRAIGGTDYFICNDLRSLLYVINSVRPRPGAPVNTPLRWSQVTARLRPERFTIKTLPRQMKRDGDPFGAVLGEGVDVVALLEALALRLAAGAGR